MLMENLFHQFRQVLHIVQTLNYLCYLINKNKIININYINTYCMQNNLCNIIHLHVASTPISQILNWKFRNIFHNSVKKPKAFGFSLLNIISYEDSSSHFCAERKASSSRLYLLLPNSVHQK